MRFGPALTLIPGRRTRLTELVKSGDAEKIYFISGDWVSITSAPRFLWIKKHEPEVFGKIAHMGMIADWILYRLSGEFVTEPSIGSSSGMFDLKTRSWSPEILEMVGLEREIFPRVTSSGIVVGTVTKKASLETFLAEGTPVVVGGADTQLGLVGIGVSRPGQVTILGGSFWQHTILLDKPLDRFEDKIENSMQHHRRPVDARGNRILLWIDHALVQRRVLPEGKSGGKKAWRRCVRADGKGSKLRTSRFQRRAWDLL